MPDAVMPDARGHFGAFGGRYVPETLVPALDELLATYLACREDAAFLARLADVQRHYVGRPTPLYHALRLGDKVGCDVYLKREDLCHTGAHKINNALGQALVAKRMGKPRVIAETGAGQHGVATATACALLDLRCDVYMGEEDIRRQALNVHRMHLLGARVLPVTSGTRTLKDATNEAMRDWVANVRDTHYIVGSVVGPHPFPMIVRDFQSIIGREARAQFAEAMGGLPSVVTACVGGGSNAMGMFHAFVPDAGVRLVGVEAAGRGVETGEHCATLSVGRPGVLHGSRSYLLQDGDGQVLPSHSISAGLDYPGVGPEHSHMKETGRAEYVSVTDDEALVGFQMLSRTEGIIPALESSHAIAHLTTLAPTVPAGGSALLCLSGRGDKDMETAVGALGLGNALNGGQ